MTLTEAIGVRFGDIDAKTGEKLTHSEIYGRAIKFLGGLDVVAKFIPVPMYEIRKKIKIDPYLNNTPIRLWDAAAMSSIWQLYRKHGITSASCSQGVCILKEAARLLADLDPYRDD